MDGHRGRETSANREAGTSGPQAEDLATGDERGERGVAGGPVLGADEDPILTRLALTCRV